MKEQGSFVLYHDMESSIRELTDEEAGKLLKAIFRYHKTGDPGESDRVVRMAFLPIKSVLDRDREKYRKICERNSRNGSQWGRPREEPKEPKEPTGFSGNPDEPKHNPSEPKKADSDSDSDSDTKVDTSLRSVSTAPGALALSEKSADRKRRVDELIEMLKSACETAGVMYSAWPKERERAWNILTAKQFAANAASVGQTPEVFAQNIIMIASKLTYCPHTNNAVTVYSNYSKVFSAAMKEKQKLNEKPSWIEA